MDTIRNQYYGPLVKAILELIQEQITFAVQMSHDEPKLIVLTGGFGMSAYLHNIIKDSFPNVKLVMKAGQGACIQALEGTIKYACHKLNGGESEFPMVGHPSYHTYGTFRSVIFDPHDRCSNVRPFLHSNGHNFFEGQSPIWLVREGFAPDTSLSMAIELKQLLVSPAIQIHVPIMASFFPNPSMHAQTNDQYFVHIADIRSGPIPDFADLDTSEIGSRRAREVEYELEVSFDGEKILFSIYYNNAHLGSRSIPFDAK